MLDNAVKFTEEGEITLEVEEQADLVAVRVKDTGTGVDPAFRPHLFEAFTQQSTGLTRSHDGIGVGLTVAKRLVELLGGTIAVESEQGKGSLFTVSFPSKAMVKERPAARMPRKQRNASGNPTT